MGPRASGASKRRLRRKLEPGVPTGARTGHHREHRHAPRRDHRSSALVAARPARRIGEETREHAAQIAEQGVRRRRGAGRIDPQALSAPSGRPLRPRRRERRAGRRGSDHQGPRPRHHDALGRASGRTRRRPRPAPPMPLAARRTARRSWRARARAYAPTVPPRTTRACAARELDEADRRFPQPPTTAAPPVSATSPPAPHLGDRGAQGMTAASSSFTSSDAEHAAGNRPRGSIRPRSRRSRVAGLRHARGRARAGPAAPQSPGRRGSRRW